MKNIVLGVLVFVLVFAAGCGPRKPKSFIRTAEPGWKVIELRKDLDYDKAFSTATETVGGKYDIEVLNKEGGYLRTSWIYTYIRSGTVVDRYRTRITVKFSVDRTQCEVKAEANWLEKRGWIMGYDETLLTSVYSDLQGKLGNVVR